MAKQNIAGADTQKRERCGIALLKSKQGKRKESHVTVLIHNQPTRRNADDKK